MTSVSNRPVARLSSPGDIVATVPALCGFVPHDSVVLLSLRGTRRRLGLAVRLDLPPPAQVEDAAAELAARVWQDGGLAAVLVVYAAAPAPALAAAVEHALAARGVRLVEGLHVTGGRWTSYLCAGPCCPAQGTPIPEPPPLVAAEHALSGRAVLPSRDDLVRALAPPSDDAYRERVRQAQVAFPADGSVQVGTALERVSAGVALDPVHAAEVAVALHDVRLRDGLLAQAALRDDAVLALAHEVARLVGPPHDAPVCAVLAWVAYSRGDGARANVALDRALRADPGYSLALLLQAALEGGVPPRELRRTLRRAGRTAASS